MSFPLPLSHTLSNQGLLAANGQFLWHESRGPESGPAILLIMGMDAQCTLWPIELIQNLMEAGFRVIRFDNRDVGLSGRVKKWQRWRPYRLEDMAKDSIELLDALGIDKAHVIGASMGGMIAQRMALSYPKRILSLCSIMSSGYAFDPSLARRPNLKRMMQAAPLLARLRPLPQFGHQPAKAEEAIAMRLAIWKRFLKGSRFPEEQPRVEALIQHNILVRKGYNPLAADRHICAILASGSRLKELPQLQQPTLIVHGSEDRLIRPDHARKYAQHIPRARLLWMDKVGHELPLGILNPLSQEIIAHLQGKEGPAFHQI